MIIKNTLYSGKSIDQLSESEKQTITFLSQLAGGLAAGVVGDSTQSASLGADIGKRAVENNFFNTIVNNPEYISSLSDFAKGKSLKEEIDEKATIESAEYISNHPYDAMKDVVDEVAPHYFSGGLSLYKYNVKFAFNLRKGDLFLGGGISHLPVISNSVF